jgi:hypothetical protein
VILIDIHPAGEIWLICHTHHADSPRMTTFCKSLRGRNIPLYSEEILVPNDCPARSLTWLTSFFLPCVSLGVGEQRFGQVVTKLLGILGSYHQYAISTFNTYSRVPSHRSLIDIDGGYNTGGAGFLHHSSQPTVLSFPLMVLSNLQLLISTWNLQSRCVLDLQQSSGLHTTQLLPKPITTPSIC